MLSPWSIGAGERPRGRLDSAPRLRVVSIVGGRNGRNGMTAASNVILVHGAWADGSSWSKVIPLLLDGGLRVTAVQLPLISLRGEVATVKRAIALEDGPIILV